MLPLSQSIKHSPLRTLPFYFHQRDAQRRAPWRVPKAKAEDIESIVDVGRSFVGGFVQAKSLGSSQTAELGQRPTLAAPPVQSPAETAGSARAKRRPQGARTRSAGGLP